MYLCLFKDGDDIHTDKTCYTKRCTYDSYLEVYITVETQVQCRRIDELPVCKNVSNQLYFNIN